MLLKLKDYFTLGNAACGFGSVLFVVQQAAAPQGDFSNLRWAAYMILIAWAFDISDGMVARLTKQFNAFGGELDNVADLIAYSVAPSFLVFGYYHFKMGMNQWGYGLWPAAAVGSLLLLSGCIRFARFNLIHRSYDGAWMGLPRPAAAFLIVGYLNASIVNSYPILQWAGIGVVVYAAAMQMMLIPFCSNHWKKMPTFLKLSIFLITSSTFLGIVIDVCTADFSKDTQGVTFNIVTFWLLLYLFVHRWLVFSPRMRKEIKQFVADWKAEEGTL